MRILSIETSTEYLSVAVGDGTRTVAEEIRAGQRHSELVLGMVDALLVRAGIGVAALDAVAFGAGPGSFTGLRIACGVAQGIAFARGLPVVPVDAFRAIAVACNRDRVAVAIDARMREVYFAALEAAEEIVRAQVVKPELLDMLRPGRWSAAGTGFAVHRDVLLARLGVEFDEVLPEARPHAGAIDRIARAELIAGRAVDAAAAAPWYVRDRVALTIEERGT